MTVSEEIKERLRALAAKYETADFVTDDPSRVLRRYTAQADIETAALIAAVLAFGRREQFLPKTNRILDLSDRYGGPAEWIRSGRYQETFSAGHADRGAAGIAAAVQNGASPAAVRTAAAIGGATVAAGVIGGAAANTGAGAESCAAFTAGAATGAVCAESAAANAADCFAGKNAAQDKKFYRFYSYRDMTDLFSALRRILRESVTLGAYFREKYKAACSDSGCGVLPLAPVVCDAFQGCAAVPHGRMSANKRMNLYLRWMIRRNSPVDLGLWDWYSPADLIMPLDTHVIHEAVALGLLPPNSAGTAKTAALLTAVMKQIWPDDPCAGDFALFGLGVDSART